MLLGRDLTLAVNKTTTTVGSDRTAEWENISSSIIRILSTPIFSLIGILHNQVTLKRFGLFQELFLGSHVYVYIIRPSL
ncbi:unnamed protein product [Cochlearia groenlandica]